MDEFPDSSDLATSRNRGEPCWGLEITSQVLYCAHCRNRSRFPLRAFRIQVVKRLTGGTRAQRVGPPSRVSSPGRRNAIPNIDRFRLVAKRAHLWTRCFIFSHARLNGRRIPTTPPRGKSFPPLAARMRVSAPMLYPFWSTPRAHGQSLRGKALPGTNTGDRQRRQA
jgi:hypothetical protein